MVYFDGLMQHWGNSRALAMELPPMRLSNQYRIWYLYVLAAKAALSTT